MIKSITLPRGISYDLAYLCGILAGDGSIYKRENKHDYIIKCVGNPKDEKELYFNIICPLFKKIFGFTPAIKMHDSGTTFGFVIYSKILYLYFIENICLPSGKKYEDLKIPVVFKIKKNLTISFIRGVFDTDGCMCFKRRYKEVQYYPVISFSSKSKTFVFEIARILKELGFKIVETYDYKVFDKRFENGFSIINRIELNGNENLRLWLSKINFFSPKHLKKIEKYWEGSGKGLVAGRGFEFSSSLPVCFL